MLHLFAALLSSLLCAARKRTINSIVCKLEIHKAWQQLSSINIACHAVLSKRNTEDEPLEAGHFPIPREGPPVVVIVRRRTNMRLLCELRKDRLEPANETFLWVSFVRTTNRPTRPSSARLIPAFGGLFWQRASVWIRLPVPGDDWPTFSTLPVRWMWWTVWYLIANPQIGNLMTYGSIKLIPLTHQASLHQLHGGAAHKLNPIESKGESGSKCHIIRPFVLSYLSKECLKDLASKTWMT